MHVNNETPALIIFYACYISNLAGNCQISRFPIYIGRSLIQTDHSPSILFLLKVHNLKFKRKYHYFHLNIVYKIQITFLFKGSIWLYKRNDAKFFIKILIETETKWTPFFPTLLYSFWILRLLPINERNSLIKNKFYYKTYK